MKQSFIWKVIGIIWLGTSGCASHHVPAVEFTPPPVSAEPQASSTQNNVTRMALSLVGTPYRYGGISPEEGFDCTGFINYVYRNAANIELPRESHELVLAGVPVRGVDLRPADIVYFRIENQKPLHVGIYLGDRKFIHSPSTGGKVNVQSLSVDYWKSRFLGGRRIISAKHQARPKNAI